MQIIKCICELLCTEKKYFRHHHHRRSNSSQLHQRSSSANFHIKYLSTPKYRGRYFAKSVCRILAQQQKLSTSSPQNVEHIALIINQYTYSWNHCRICRRSVSTSLNVCSVCILRSSPEGDSSLGPLKIRNKYSLKFKIPI